MSRNTMSTVPNLIYTLIQPRIRVNVTDLSVVERSTVLCNATLECKGAENCPLGCVAVYVLLYEFIAI
jgi:hypothetical protein